jgi:hypothetical protein
MPQQTLLFLDIQGVLALPYINGSLLRPFDPFAQAIPGAKELIADIDAAEWIEPMWISSLGSQALEWNTWANTQHWELAYPLPNDQIGRARQHYSKVIDDRKCLAARWCSRRWLHRIVWIEDGFSNLAREWADENPRVELVDTLQFHRHPVRDTVDSPWMANAIRQKLELTVLNTF